MYELLDTPAAIKEVQKFLHVISDRVNSDIPRVAIDGIYGKETSAAVKAFQVIYGLPATGKVERETFDSLFFEYNKALIDKNIKDYIITDIGFPIKIGSQGNDVISIHLYITELGKTYADIGEVGRGSYFSEASRDATVNIQKIFNLSPTGEIDARLYQRIITEIDAIRRREDIYE